MSRPAVFFDRDNTLIANSDYLGDPEGVVLIPGAADAVARVRRLGFVTVVVSNQSGVGRGMFTEADVHAVNDRMNAALLELDADAVIDHHEFCPHHPKATVERYKGDSPRRKPQPGMLLDAAESLDLDLTRSWLIGDAPRDVEAGHRAGCRTILVREPLDSVSPAANEKLKIDPDYTASSLQDAVDFIEMQLEQSTLNEPLPTSPFIEDRPEMTEDSPADAAADARPVASSLTIDDEAAAAAETIEQSLPDRPVDDVAHEASSAIGFAASDFKQDEPDYGGPLPVATAADEQAIASTDHHTEAAPRGGVTSALGAMTDAIVNTAPPTDHHKHEILLLERIVEELRRGNDPPEEFSVTRMLAAIVQGFAIAVMVGAMLYRDNPAMFTTLMLIAIFLQTMVASLALMGR